MRQVLINLLGNAMESTGAGGAIFKVGVLESRTPQESGQGKIYKLRFQIEDTDTGMSPEQLDKIFQPFEQVGDSSRKAKGTGLGLAITKKIVNIMGGISKSAVRKEPAARFASMRISRNPQTGFSPPLTAPPTISLDTGVRDRESEWWTAAGKIAPYLLIF
ncbi:ATP-binding protein [Kamptonema formosum]|uniref:ATP-binding protein n=1 Tax=Kamptonema formosum TaxID=331992 RepID=UPI00210199AA|nr:ATP-binding protein [Oscillatoria sp. PCC 10802]